MTNTLGKSLGILRRIRARKNRMVALMLVLSLVVSLDVFWILRQPGLTMAGDATCGIQEHTHDENCGVQVCICGLSEEAHVHDETCYQTRVVEEREEVRLICEETEDPHIHNDNCYETIENEGAEERVCICELVSEPHVHSESCYEVERIEGYEEQILICDLPETAHIHDDSCYEWQMTCTLVEHVHSISCYSDDKADVETLLDWQEMFAGFPYSGNLSKDLVGIAKTQVGYAESTRNFEIGQDGLRRGYTRYGAWYGTPYRDWSAMFVSFCLNYAGADPDEAPGNAGANAMAERWKGLGKYASAGEYIPAVGDLAFFRDNTVGIVAEVNHTTFNVICGDVDDTVCAEVMSLSDQAIVGWGMTETPVPSQEAPPEAEEPEEVTEEPTEIREEEQDPSDLTEEETIPPDAEEVPFDLLDISNGPAVFIFTGGDGEMLTQNFSMRMTRTTVTDLISYLEAKDGNYFYTLVDRNNQELPKDEAGNYVVQAETGYKLTLTIHNPEGFLPGTYQYQIPNGLMVDGGAGNFVLRDGTNVGSWKVTDDGLITLEFNQNMNNRTDITISATMGIIFPATDTPVDFDGLITVKVEPPPQQENPTVITKWGVQGNPDNENLDPSNSEHHKTDPTKIYWTVRVDGHADSQIPGHILTDQIILDDWGKPHSYTESDIAGGLTFGVSDPNGGWHSWHVSADDPLLIWDETGWSYKIPKTVTCDYCGELELGNEGWIYHINYSSTATPMNMPGTFDYENKITVDGQVGWGWANFTHGAATAVITKNGSFVADASGGGFLWEFQATIPGRVEGQRAEYSWFIMDEMRLLDENGNFIGRVQNDADLSMVTATYNGTTIQIPRIQDATDQDMFAWDNAWTATENGISHTRTINLLTRCRCTPETCHWTGCGDYWFQYDDGTWGTKGFCQCWTETQNMTFTFVYRTKDMGMIQGYGALGYQVTNSAQLYYMPDANTSVRVSNDDATVPVPNIFEKQLSQDFDGYTANYHITINEAKVPLTNGLPLTIRDEMTETLAFISGSMVITAEDANGHVTTLQQDIDYTYTYDGTGNVKDKNGKPVHILEIEILRPQPVMYILDYDTTLIIPSGATQAVKYTNSATITLWGEQMSDTTAEKVYADINIAAKSYKVEMYKTAALTKEPLSGATFGLFNDQGGQITTGDTDANGQLLFETNITEGIILREHVLYYMQELKAPEGYQLDGTKYWFCFCDHMGEYCETCERVMADVDALRIPFEQIGKVHMENEIMSYNLPATGGPGTKPLILASGILVITPLVYGFIRRRKRERRRVR